MKFRWSLLFLVLFFPFAAHAEVFADSSGISGNNYFGVNLSGLRYSEQDSEVDTHETGLGLRFGHGFGDYLAVEGHAVAGLDDDVILGGLRIGIDYLLGVYLRGNMFLWDPRARLYGLVGVTRGKLTAEALGLTDTLTDTEMSYGVGFEFYGDDRNAINLEYMRYLDGEDNGFDYDVDAFSIGYTHRF